MALKTEPYFRAVNIVTFFMIVLIDYFDCHFVFFCVICTYSVLYAAVQSLTTKLQ